MRIDRAFYSLLGHTSLQKQTTFLHTKFGHKILNVPTMIEYLPKSYGILLKDSKILKFMINAVRGEIILL